MNFKQSSKVVACSDWDVLNRNFGGKYTGW